MTYQTALVLEAIAAGRHHGFDIMDATDLPSGTVYPILRRIEDGGARSLDLGTGLRGEARAEAGATLLRADVGGGCAAWTEARSRFRAMETLGARMAAPLEAGMMFRLSLALLRVFARLVPRRQRAEWLEEWESELHVRRMQLPAAMASPDGRRSTCFDASLGSFQ